jgi:asparagine synthase (glutamine-hydrolysing)
MNVYLLHTRLKIIDPEPRANQPFAIGSKWLAYNGELYNYVELRKDLARLGYSFTTDSDTEVLLRTIDHFGWQGLDRCEGMWAFAVYDIERGSMTLCRDRFGEKPLYLYRHTSGLYFGSEVKFIAALLGHRLEVNLDQLYRYLVNGYKALYKGAHTFFKDLVELPPASVIHIDDKGYEERLTYWRPRFYPDHSMSYAEAVAGTREKLIRSVELRLRADVPLAFCMSGGVDSNSLISIARNLFGYEVHGFTIVNTDARYEEQEMVDHAVKQLGIRHTAVPLTYQGFLASLQSLVRQHDAPVYTISLYAEALLMSAIAESGYRIAVSGNGADEIFTGYYDHHLQYLYEIWGTDLFESALRAWKTRVEPFVRNPYLKNPYLFFTNGNRDYVYFNKQEFSAYLTQDWNEDFIEEDYTDSLLRRRMMNELFHESIPVVLHDEDLNAMYYSIENRTPYLDRSLFEFAYRIPTRLLIRDGFAKAILRDAMRGIVPEQILNNPRKVGFNAPIQSLLDIDDPDVRSYLLDDSPIFEHVNRDKIEALISKSDFPNSESKFLFSFLSGKMFLEEFAA